MNNFIDYVKIFDTEFILLMSRIKKENHSGLVSKGNVLK